MPKRAPRPCTCAATPCLAKRSVQAVEQQAGDGVDVVVEAGLAIRGDGGQGRGDDDRMAVVGAAVLAVAGRHQPVHDVASAAEDAERIAAADRLAERAQVGRDAEIFLRPAGAHAKGAEHLVEDQAARRAARSSFAARS